MVHLAWMSHRHAAIKVSPIAAFIVVGPCRHVLVPLRGCMTLHRRHHSARALSSQLQAHLLAACSSCEAPVNVHQSDRSLHIPKSLQRSRQNKMEQAPAWSQSRSCCSDSDTISPVAMALMDSTTPMVAKAQLHAHPLVRPVPARQSCLCAVTPGSRLLMEIPMRRARHAILTL